MLTLIDEDKPKCFVCLDQFENMKELKMHQESVHKEIFEKYEKNSTEN